MKEGLVLGKSELVAVRVLLYFLTDDAKDVYHAHISLCTRMQTIALTCIYIVHALISSLWTENVLQSAFDEVTSAEQLHGEDEFLYAPSITDGSRAC